MSALDSLLIGKSLSETAPGRETMQVFKRRKTWFAGIALLVLVVLFLITRGPEAPTPNPPGTFSFAVLGDAPYYEWEDLQYRLVLQALDAHDLSWVIDVGDIFWRPCSDELYRRNLERFNGLRHPVIYTPGDNEWTDCWEPRSGGFAPLDRLSRIRQIFFNDANRSLGGRALPLLSQENREPFGEFVENVRWSHQGIVFATVHIVGSTNAMKAFPSRTEADDAAAKRRTEAAAAWVRETFAEARSSNSLRLYSASTGTRLSKSQSTTLTPGLRAVITAVEEEVERFARRF